MRLHLYGQRQVSVKVEYGTSYIISQLGYGGLIASGSLNVWRDNESDENIHISGTAYSSFSTYGSPVYDFDNSIAVIQGGELRTVNNEADRSNKYVINGTEKLNKNMGRPNCSYKFDNFKINCTDNNTTFYICFYCHQSGGCTQGYSGGSHSDWIVVGSFNTKDLTKYNPHAYPSISLSATSGVNDWTIANSRTYIHCWWSRNKDNHNHTITLKANGSQITSFSSSAGSGAFDQEYTTPATGDSSYKVEAEIVDDIDGNYRASTDYTRYVWGKCSIAITVAHKKIVAGNKNSVTVKLGNMKVDSGALCTVVLYFNGKAAHTWVNLNSGDEHTLTFDVEPSKEDTTYEVKAVWTHGGSGETNEASTTFRTYVTPKVSEISGPDRFSPQDNAEMSWTNNVDRITADDVGETSLQKITILNSSITDTSYNDTTSVQLAPTGTYWTETIYNSAERSVEELNGTLNVTLTNTSSGVSATSTKKYKVQYKPTKEITDVVVQNQNKAVAINEYPTTKVQWKYPYNAGSAGVVSGFEIKVYADSTHTKLVSTLDLTVPYSEYITDHIYEYDLNNATDLMRGVINYANIVPYYKFPNLQNGEVVKSYGPDNYYTLVKPYSYMAKPVISYPISNTVWHNNNFRVLMQLNKDMDYDTYEAYTEYSGVEIQSVYKYSDVEIKVNDTTIYAFSGRYTNKTAHNEIFSTDVDEVGTNNHMKLIAINPSLVEGFPNTDVFNIQVRVQRGNYYFTDEEMRDETVKTWSEWSDPVVLNKSEIVAQNLEKGMIIKAEHYQKLHNWGLRLLQCYPLRNKDDRDIDQVRGDFIEGSEIVPENGEYLGVYNTILNIRQGVNTYCTYNRAPVKFNGIMPDLAPKTEIITSKEVGKDKYDTSGRNYINLLTRYMNDYLK